jgi:glycosyltransferase involved in cell wall biosynthesis
MKICFLAPANSAHSYRWIRYFVDNGHEIHWISLHPAIAGAIPGVRFYDLGCSSRGILDNCTALWSVRRIVANIDPDVLHVHSAALYGLAGALSGRHPMILTVWGSDILMSGTSRIKQGVVKFILRKADRITCDANHMVTAITRLGIDQELITIIHFGVEVDIFTPKEKDMELREKLGVGDVPVVIGVRNFYPVYDVGSLLHAGQHILKIFPDTMFIIVGAGPEELMLKALAKSLGIAQNTLFVGLVPNYDLVRYFNASDVYVSTSLSDAGIAASTAEAMACGLPIVITNSGENDKWVKDGHGGFLVPICSPELIAERVIALLRDGNLRKRFGNVNRRTIVEANNYYKEMKQMDALYNETVSLISAPTRHRSPEHIDSCTKTRR